MTKKGSLFINIGAKIDGFKKGLNKSIEMLAGYKQRVSDLMPSFGTGMLGGLVGGIGLTGIMGVLMNASPKFAAAVLKLTDLIVPLAVEIGDKLAPFVAKLTDALPGVINGIVDFGIAAVTAYENLQKSLTDWAEENAGDVAKDMYGDPSEPITREQLDVLREIRDGMREAGGTGNVSEVNDEFRKGNGQGLDAFTMHIAEKILIKG